MMSQNHEFLMVILKAKSDDEEYSKMLDRVFGNYQIDRKVRYS